MNFCMCIVCDCLCMVSVSMQSGECICMLVGLGKAVSFCDCVCLCVIFCPKTLCNIGVVSELVRGGSVCVRGICDFIPAPPSESHAGLSAVFLPPSWGPDQLERIRALPPPPHLYLFSATSLLLSLPSSSSCFIMHPDSVIVLCFEFIVTSNEKDEIYVPWPDPASSHSPTEKQAIHTY